MSNLAPTVIPALRYKDPVKAIRWLVDTLGLTEAMVVPDGDGGVAHAQLAFGTGMVMLGPVSDGHDGRLAVPHGPAWVYLVVEDIEAHYERATAAGAEIVQELREEDYGGKGFVTRDLEGNVWSFGTYHPQLP